ncbi:hypothetical protein ONZ51_g6457 [Trametes cubensis]|uniref:Thioredoxin-like protein n=1 Tax=Trametes cubensis TaxID=1111947 RepID=A0AAD7TUI3_9APHY|nr:hypothetical protein ONZ51_g6457 [Trametes cubensis]
MVQNAHITLYGHSRSPFCHRVHLALEEAKADYTFYAVDIRDQPLMAWYAETINPVGKQIPAITYGPKGDPRNPAPESAAINESLVILEFLADVFPEAHLLPVDPILRARVRLFINTVESKLVEGFRQFFFAYTPGADAVLLSGFEAIQALLPPTGFAAGEWSLADIAAAPFTAWVYLMLEHDLGPFPAGEGLRLFELLKSPKFARLLAYIEEVQERPSFKRTFWGKDLTIEFWRADSRFQRQ